MPVRADRSGAPALLVISRGGHPRVDQALADLRGAGHLRAAWHVAVPERQDGSDGPMWSELSRHVIRHRVEFVVLHHYHSPGLPDARDFLESRRQDPHCPVVALTGGDAFYNGFFRPSHPQVFEEASAAADIVLNTSMGAAADAIARYGARRIALWPNSACGVRFPKPREPYRAAGSDFDIVFVGSNNASRNPAHTYFWIAKRRERLVRLLARRFGQRFAVFGRGWDDLSSAQGPIAFDEQLTVCRRARIVVGGVPYSPARYYTSNRPFIQIMSGVPFVDMAVEGAETLLRDGEHWHLADSIDRIPDLCDELLTRSDRDREELGECAARYIASRHRSSDRWLDLLGIMRDLRTSLVEGVGPEAPKLNFFLPEVDAENELPHATRGWGSSPPVGPRARVRAGRGDDRMQQRD